MVSREAYDAAGEFDPALSHAGDYELWLRISHIARAHFDPETLGSYRVRGGSLMADVTASYAENEALYRGLLDTLPPEAEEERAPLSRALAFLLWKACVWALLRGQGTRAAWGHFSAGCRVAGGPLRVSANLSRFALRTTRGLPLRIAMIRSRRKAAPREST